MNSQKFIFILATLLFLISLISLVSSQEGCFTHEGSLAYCSDINIEEAKQECSFYENCNLLEAFHLDESCNNLDQFPVCKKILCKSTCQEEFSGKCVAGEIPIGEQESWCSPGCCRFSYFGQEPCDYKESKWLCEIEVRNREATEFIYIPSTKQECNQQCTQDLVMLQKVEKGLQIEQVSPGLVNFQKQSPGELPIFPTPKSKQESITGKKDLISLSNLLMGLLFLLFLGGVLFLFYQSRKKLITKKLLPSKIERKKTSPNRLDFRSLNPFTQKRLKNLKWKSAHKKKEHQREEMFTEFGVAPVKMTATYINKLKQIVKRNQSEKESRGESQKTDSLNNLDSLAKIMEEREQKKKKKKEEKNKNEEAISQLKGIANKK